MKIQYTTQTERNALIAEWVNIKGYRLAEEQNHTDGNYLVFESPTEYHALDAEDKWVFDKEVWLDAEVRPERDIRLRASDYKMLIDVREMMTVEETQKWKDYRQSLRDLTQTIGDVTEPIDVVWPKEPI